MFDCLRRRRRTRGTATVEFAFVAPVLFLFVIATLELWRVNMIRFVAHQAAYQASREGMIPGVTASALQQTALDVMAAIGAIDTEVDVDPLVIEDDTEEVTVTVRVPMAANAFFIPQFYTNPYVSGASTLRRESTELQ